jgi:predicted DCC family thiol-disulfide oxidoreductase YuxK
VSHGGQPADPVVLYDGICPLCAGSVLFLARRDPARRLRFATLQSPAARRLLATRGLAVPDSEAATVLLLEGDVLYRRSEAALRALRRLSAPWCWLSRLRVLPRRLRDGIYMAVARRRRRWFGRRERCRLPAPDIADRFLPDGLEP